jgi:hypothetical protein
MSRHIMSCAATNRPDHLSIATFVDKRLGILLVRFADSLQQA